MKRLSDAIFYAIAGVLLAVMFGLMFIVGNANAIDALKYVGWVVWATGIILLSMPFFYFRRKGRVSQDQDYTHTTTLVDSGVYAVIRHPQYLGWMLMYPAMMLFIQHWLFVLLGIAGMACVVVFTRQEEQRLIHKFGDDYRDYMQRVPRFNLLVGVIRLLRRTG